MTETIFCPSCKEDFEGDVWVGKCPVCGRGYYCTEFPFEDEEGNWDCYLELEWDI